ncbi:DNA independent RNA polymerase I transcription factor, partial [Coemansia thaxteri]
SRYTQFFVFYLCGRDPQFADVFLGTMMGIVGEPVRSTASGQASTVTKVAAASYLSSLVSRARYLPGNIVRNVVGVLVQWASTYLEVQDQLQCEAEEELRRRQPHPWAKTYAQVTATGLQSSATDFERHAVFYAVTQAIMYLFCFRWRDLAEAAGGGAVIESELDNLRWCQEVEGVQRVIFSKLNPLRACSPAVAQQFSQVASQTNYMFCYAVLQQNRRTGDAADEGSAANSKSPPTHIQILRTELVTFFPFDPMLLPISRQFIDDIYLVWQNVGAEPSDSNDDNDDGDESSEDGRDDADVVDQMVAMSISPVRPLSVLTGQPF